MKLIVFSDNHGDSEVINMLKLRYPNEMFVCLGDIELSKQDLIGMNIRCVKGNSYFDPNYPENIVFDFEGKKFFATHGHRFNVRDSLLGLKYKALEYNADVALYGHTHKVYLEQEENGLIILNPGSLRYPRGKFNGEYEKTYAEISIIKDRVNIAIKEIYTGAELWKKLME